MSRDKLRVVVVRLDALGDTLLSTPAIYYLQKEYGAENVLVLVSTGLGVIFGESIPYVEVAPASTEWQIAKVIDEFEPDLVFVFTEKKRALKAASLSKARHKVGFDPGWSQPLRSAQVKHLLTIRLSIVNSRRSASCCHEVERYCKLVAKGLQQQGVPAGPLQFFALPARARQFLSREARIGFQWTSKWLRGGWPLDLMLKALESTPPTTLIFVEPGELEEAKKVVPLERCAMLTSLPLLQYAKAVTECRYLISVDTGAVHIAAAVGTPVVDIFPEEDFEHVVPRWRPWLVPHQVVLKPGVEAGIDEVLERIARGCKLLEATLDWFSKGLPSSG